MVREHREDLGKIGLSAMRYVHGSKIGFWLAERGKKEAKKATFVASPMGHLCYFT